MDIEADTTSLTQIVSCVVIEFFKVESMWYVCVDVDNAERISSGVFTNNHGGNGKKTDELGLATKGTNREWREWSGKKREIKDFYFESALIQYE